MKRAYFISVLFIFTCLRIYSQSIGDIVNSYLKVDSVFNDTIRVVGSSELDSFSAGDYVLFIQMTGAEIYETGLFPRRIGQLKDERNCGKYEFLQIESIIIPQNYIVFTSYFLNDYDNGEDIQLVKLCTGDEITVTSEVVSDPWDGNTGGIVAIMAYDKLILNADINVNYQGLRGAVPVEDYTGGCRFGFDPPDTCYFSSTQLNRAGNKGEGIINNSFTYTKGAGNALNGGGGGNGLYSGGAGGSNWGFGGDGGHQSWSCGIPVNLVLAQRGYTLWPFYLDTINKVVLGGGGGASTENEALSKNGTPGGNGGGIIFVLTDTLISNNHHSITANGQDVTGVATAGGGGGGGGGSILIDAANKIGNISLSVRGGKGGDTDDNCTGAGGGGGGGIVMHSGSSMTFSSIDTSGGPAGAIDFGTCSDYTGFEGDPGRTMGSLILPLNGFLFNIIYGADTLCEGQVPNTIVASQPKGGSGSYIYEWLQSYDKLTWSPAQGTADLLSLSPYALDTTTFYRRVVSSEHSVYKTTFIDSGKIVEIFVYPSILNNELYVTDTICSGVVPQELTGGIVTGGNGIYSYSWQRKDDQSIWQEVSEDSAFFETALTETKFYKRIVTSAKVCADTSETDTITALPIIANNLFNPDDTTICKFNDAGKLVPLPIEGGDGTYSYKWVNRDHPGKPWIELPFTDSAISPGILTDTTYYRRIVFSGNDDACIDTSNTRTVYVLPTVESNTIETDSLRYCAGDTPNQITGSAPGGGDGFYTYKWLKMIGSEWLEIAGATDTNFVPSEIYETTTYLTRVVISGNFLACKDTAAPIMLDIVPYIINILDADNQSVCENNTPAELAADAASGGAGGFIYEWLWQEEGAAWEPAPAPNNSVSYSPGPLTDTSYFARKVYSDICFDISDTVKVTVYSSVTNNNITGGTVQYTCFNTGKSLYGSSPADGKTGDYGYKWEYSDDLLYWVDATGETPDSGNDFETSALHDSAYFRRIVFSSALNKECSDTSNHVKILINPVPSGDVISSHDTICEGESVYIKLNIDGVHSPWKATVGSGTTNTTKTGITANYDSIPVVLDSSAIIKLIEIVDDSLCYADTSLVNGIVNAVVYQVPVANAGNSTEVCGLEYVLNAKRSISNSAGLWRTTGGTFDSPDSTNARVTMDNYGPATLTWIETNWQCPDSGDIRVIFYEQPKSAEAGMDQNLSFIFSADLDATPAVGTGTWTISSGSGKFDNDTVPNTTVSYLDYENILKWTVRNGVCKDVHDSMRIIVNPLKVTKGFSPNGDGINDELVIDIDNSEKTWIIIFDRQGHIVHQSDNYQEGSYWDGTNDNGKKLPEGTYFYILKVKVEGKEEVIIRSYVELIR